jgi:NitT/TauT family transport system permease protein
MSKTPVFWGIHAKPPPMMRRFLSLLPFLLLIAVYMYASDLRLKENPQDKLLPSFSSMVDAIKFMAFEADKRTGEYLMLVDTISSLKRLAIGVGLSAFVGLFLGLGTGLFQGFNALFTPFVTFISIIPPLAMLPILFITFGVDELAKVMLIFIGTFPLITRDIYTASRNMPVELITKAFTLGASSTQIAFRIVLPQLMPRLLETVRLSLGGAWLFLIASEAIASTDGLGYRIFLVRRYLAMDIIIPYVLWITFLGFTFDWLLQRFNAWRYPWYNR